MSGAKAMKFSLPAIHSSSTRLVLILGHPLSHTLSPAMQNAAFQKAKLPWLYLPLDVSPNQLKPVLGITRTAPFIGANVTVPYKEAVLPYLDYVEPEAKWLGSVNTLYRKGNKLFGTSTDGEGFLRSLGDFRKKLRGSRGLLLGAGGASKAVAGALARSGVKGFSVANRSGLRAGRLVKSLRSRYRSLDLESVDLKGAEKILPRCDWVIQATSVGLKKGDPSPLSLKTARSSTWVMDLIYHRETAFLKEARAKRLAHLGGLGMLLHQGALSFERWSGKKAPLNVMRRVLLNSLGSQ
jgi:shikimate dehydrogenase